MTICENKKCTGCGACADACPKNCITIQSDRDGFLRSIVDTKVCVNCKSCVAVCPVNHPQNNHPVQQAWKIRRKDTNALMGSTSGGAAALLSESFVRSGGTVCGCSFDENLILRHTAQSTPDGLEQFKGSKYVQSHTAGIYRQCRQLLKDGQKVLFIGTPCQVSGLKSFLKTDYQNLFIVDLICHGVASEAILNRYVQMHQTQQEKVVNIHFRSKQQGYLDSQKNDLILEYSNRQTAIAHQKGIVLWFASGLSLRESCYGCQFVSTNRCGDMTLADYIGTDMTPDDRRYGASMVFVNSPKGQDMLNSIVDELYAQEQPLEEALSKYGRMHKKSQVPKLRKRFFADLQKLSIPQMEEKYTLKRILPGKLTLYYRAALRRLKLARK